MSISLRIITPDSIVLDTEIEEAILPSSSGQLGILQNHAKLLTAIDIGVLRVRDDKNTWSPVVLFGGFAEIEDNKLIILVNGAEEVNQLSLDSVKLDLDEKTKDLANASTSKEKITATQNLRKAKARYQALSA